MRHGIGYLATRSCRLTQSPAAPRRAASSLAGDYRGVNSHFDGPPYSNCRVTAQVLAVRGQRIRTSPQRYGSTSTRVPPVEMVGIEPTSRRPPQAALPAIEPFTSPNGETRGFPSSGDSSILPPHVCGDGPLVPPFDLVAPRAVHLISAHPMGDSNPRLPRFWTGRSASELIGLPRPPAWGP